MTPQNLFGVLTRDLAAELRGGGAGNKALVTKTYRHDPIAFMVDVLHVPEHTLIWSENPGYDTHRWDGTPEPLATIADTLAKEQDVGAESGTGTGKTFLAAGLMLWFLGSWESSRVITIAPKEKQLREFLWAEVQALWPAFVTHFPDAELITLKARMIPGMEKWSAVGYPVGVGANEEVATKAQGAHAEHMLFIIEEGPGVHTSVYNAIENTCTAPHNLRLGLGNPDHQQDPLHKFCLDPTVKDIRISALDHPNVVTDDPSIIPGAVSNKAVHRRAAKYGITGRMYQSRVRGVSPSEHPEALIKYEWIRRAQELYTSEQARTSMMKDGALAMGVDVANSVSGDEASTCRGRGPVPLEILAFPCPDASELADKVHADRVAYGIDPARVGVDNVGVGASTMNTLKRLGTLARGLGGAERPWPWNGDELFRCLRDQMWWQARMDIEAGLIPLPMDEELEADLMSPRWSTENGKIVVESKKALRKRLGRSPNKGDAFVYWNWVRQNVGGVKYGGASDGGAF